MDLGRGIRVKVTLSRYIKTLQILWIKVTGWTQLLLTFTLALDLVPHGRLLVKIADSGVDNRVVVWVREFLIGRTQRVRVGGELSDEVRVTSGYHKEAY